MLPLDSILRFWSMIMLSIRPSIIHIASSLSSVIYPVQSLQGPPPGIFMQSSINLSPCIAVVNSFFEPQASPTKAPAIHPKALSTNELFRILLYISIFLLSYSSISFCISRTN
jgi:hypothetical protein